jgi:hypothetical protein
MRGRGAQPSTAGLTALLALASLLVCCWAGAPMGTGRLMVSYESSYKASVKAAIIASGHTIVYDASMCSVYTIKPNNSTSGTNVTLSQVRVDPGGAMRFSLLAGGSAAQRGSRRPCFVGAAPAYIPREPR